MVKIILSNSALNNLKSIFLLVLQVLQMKFYIGSYEVSLYAFMIYGIIAVILLTVIFSLFND